MKPLLITMGDPTGIGPEIIIQALLAGELSSTRPVIVAGDVAVLAQAARVFHVAARTEAVPGAPLLSHRLHLAGRELAVKNLSQLPVETLLPGRPDLACGRAMLDYIEWGCQACRSGQAAGLVTAPINKAAIHSAGCNFPGHTELLAERCQVEKVVMMLAGARLRVCLVTTHLPLSAVPATLSRAEIEATIRITDQALRDHCGVRTPQLAVLALNPHAGESGLFGDEEERLIVPAIAAARAAGIDASGPHSADTLFHFAARGAYDAVICMYHDQGLIPLKLLHFEDGVNVTLGLPIIRTSVDHGTAYDLVGTGTASSASLVAALRMAEEMAQKSAHLAAES
ncbi:MAG: 4-hydroxythreonine-4-phosphate dehydrogenase PdxA [Desulfuromonadales bacterium]|nr:4-hydroxythreonine-4-phosphate dehydrogenase PdxA [Desulfuromonadales bacterium]